MKINWQAKRNGLRLFALLFMLLAIAASIVGTRLIASAHIASANRSKATAGTHVTQSKRHYTTPTPFMHRPYYGSKTVAQRTTSFVDHDKPWYVNDGIFVRYDGKRWTNVAIGSCTGGVNCYDGHNGYDLNLWYEPVLSVAAGTVIRAGWYNPQNHMSALGLWAAVDHGNGYYTAYGHLSALTVSVGEQVGVQWQLGTSGTSGSSTGPHLHMATYYAPNWDATDPFGWSGNYADPNVVPDNYLWVQNAGTTGTIPVLSGSGNAVYPGATLVDDGGQGWNSTGAWNSATASSDVKGTLHWTPTTSGSATASATWQPQLSADGYYEVGVFVDDNHASSSWVPYTVYSADPNHPGNMVSHIVYVDETHIGSFQGPYGWENTGAQWISLGTYYFRASTPGRISLSNATGENGPQLSADGAEFVPVSVSTPITNPYSESFSQISLPGMLTPGAVIHMNVQARNTGAASWPSTGSASVTLGYHWLDSAGNPISASMVAASAPGTLPSDIAPGGNVTVPTTLNTPLLAGTYKLVYDFQQQGVSFSSMGATPLTTNITITPNLPKSYYFAEGYTGNGTTEYLSLTNPSAASATITITYLFAHGAAQTRSYSVAAQSHTVLNINSQVGPNQSVSMIVQSNQPFVAERSMYNQKGAFSSASDSIGSSQLSSTWYFAEGNTTYGWNTLLAIMNPSTQTATIKVTYLWSARVHSGRVPRTQLFTVAARSRVTIVLNQSVPGQQFGMAISANTAVMVERPESLVASAMRGGSSVVGATSPQARWYFGGGNTTTGVIESLVLANPNSGWVTAQVHYLTTNGQVVTQSVGVPGQSRVAIIVNKALNHATHATVITANGPIVAERQDFYNNVNSVMGSTTVMGASNSFASWYIAQGDTSSGHSESLAIANPNTTSTLVHVVYYQAQGAPIIKSYTLAGNTRMTISLSNDVGANKAVGIAVYAASPVVVEQAMLYNANGASGSYASMGYGT